MMHEVSNLFIYVPTFQKPVAAFGLKSVRVTTTTLHQLCTSRHLPFRTSILTLPLWRRRSPTAFQHARLRISLHSSVWLKLVLAERFYPQWISVNNTLYPMPVWCNNEYASTFRLWSSSQARFHLFTVYSTLTNLSVIWSFLGSALLVIVYLISYNLVSGQRWAPWSAQQYAFSHHKCRRRELDFFHTEDRSLGGRT